MVAKRGIVAGKLEDGGTVFAVAFFSFLVFVKAEREMSKHNLREIVYVSLHRVYQIFTNA